ncbi:hypothetical protein DUNSADRAFT_9097 [Dunaliella salina]|uniref:Uncharacterized protein n=1 Tax=Dunaliella salina TaxID=3046 RepID=A0ABQ7H5K4_DUNSA|nr:hypothetical protein DUNSADRAFT_9097 [Dunaliella salina]|eukprot:KAF5842138.1 hypothetical protein DUNSADRAFT_9097 [Dunaliella salina]
MQALNSPSLAQAKHSSCAVRTSRKHSRLQASSSQGYQAQQTQHTQQIQRRALLSPPTPPDVTVDLMNDLEQRQGSGETNKLVPRSAVLFPPGFRGYWHSAPQQQPKITGQTEPASLLDRSSPHATSIKPANQSKTALGSRQGMVTEHDTATQDHHLQAVVAEMRAIQTQKETVLKPSPKGASLQGGTSIGAWALGQLEHARHWKAVDAVVQVLEQAKARASKATAVEWRHAGVAVLERALLRLQELGLDPQLLGARGFGRSDWDALGSRMSSLLTSCCQASSSQPAPLSNAQSVEGMANVVSAMRSLGPSFYCRPDCDAAILH